MTEELTAGDHVTATVRLLRPLAQGGMGMVWIAEHLVLDTEVVVKLMAKQMEAAAGAAARFAREAAVAAAVKSPHVVQVFDSGVTESGVAFIVMELLDGHDLGAHLIANGRMAPEEVALVVGQLGKALAKAHRVGVIHRDLKPDNIFLCELDGGERFVKLLDFGAAKDDSRAPSSTTLGQLIGTPYYMSPEQILGEHVDTRTDIWSLGVVAYEALTGVRPFEGVTVGAITLAIHTTSPRLTTLVPELPDTVDEWFARACARDPAERFPTMRAATDGFMRAIAGEVALPDSGPGSADDLSGIPPSSTTSAGLVAVAAAAAPAVPRLASTTTSLSSTLSSPRHKERRTMMWLAGLVAAAALLAMYALLTANSGDRKTTAVLTGADPSPLIAPAPPQAASGGPATGSAIGSAGATSAGATSAGAIAAAAADAATTSAGPGAAPALSATPGPAAQATIPASPLAGSRPPALPSLAQPPRLGAPATGGAAPSASAEPAAPAAAPSPPTAPPASALPTITPEPPEAPTAPLDLRDLAPPTTGNGP